MPFSSLEVIADYETLPFASCPLSSALFNLSDRVDLALPTLYKFRLPMFLVL
jgi:hypothetical protein